MPNRDNGFVARHYVPLADLDPRLADAMLDLLRDEGIAAYASPSTGRLGGYLEVILPERPRDRLWVDREQRDRAVGLLNAHADPDSIGQINPDELNAEASGDLLDPAPLPGALAEPASSFDEPDANDSDGGSDDAWASVMASFELPAYEPPSQSAGDTRTTEHPVPRRIVRPAEKSTATGETTRAEDAGSATIGSPASVNTPSPAGWDPLDLLDEHFVPPQPPPPPRLRTATKWALAAIVVGIALIVWPHLSDSMPESAGALGVFLMIGGFVSLIANMRDDHDGRDDDGAVV
jgi:hypothetical protein